MCKWNKTNPEAVSMLFQEYISNTFVKPLQRSKMKPLLHQVDF